MATITKKEKIIIMKGGFSVEDFKKELHKTASNCKGKKFSLHLETVFVDCISETSHLGAFKIPENFNKLFISNSIIGTFDVFAPSVEEIICNNTHFKDEFRIDFMGESAEYKDGDSRNVLLRNCEFGIMQLYNQPLSDFDLYRCIVGHLWLSNICCYEEEDCGFEIRDTKFYKEIDISFIKGREPNKISVSAELSQLFMAAIPGVRQIIHLSNHR